MKNRKIIKDKDGGNGYYQEYTIVLKKCKNGYASLCLELMIVGYGESKKEALLTIKDAISSYLDSQEEGMELTRPVPLDLLHDFLKEEEEEDVSWAMPKMKVLAYGLYEVAFKH
ncbi:hypothetical protein KJ640_03970 [bacterium]|nr:hypothetical protein [bacterium]